MGSCHLEPSLECYHLEGVCVSRGFEVQGCEHLRHYLRDHLQKIKPITPIEMARDYERTLSPNKSGFLKDLGENTQQVQTGSDTLDVTVNEDHLETIKREQDRI